MKPEKITGTRFTVGLFQSTNRPSKRQEPFDTFQGVGVFSVELEKGDHADDSVQLAELIRIELGEGMITPGMLKCSPIWTGDLLIVVGEFEGVHTIRAWRVGERDFFNVSEKLAGKDIRRMFMPGEKTASVTGKIVDVFTAPALS